MKKFVDSVKERAIGKEVLTSLSPGQALVKIVNDELVEITPNHIRLRKKHLSENERKRLSRKPKNEL